MVLPIQILNPLFSFFFQDFENQFFFKKKKDFYLID